jgi:mycothiol synthase
MRVPSAEDQAMTPPVGYQLRAPRPDEADRVAELFAAATLDDPCEPTLDAGFFQDKWSRSGFDLTTDAWLFTDSAGTAVAYGQAVAEEPDVVEALGVVHPQHCGRGLGSRLLDLIEQRARELVEGQSTSPRLRHGIDGHDRAAATMLRGRGMRCVRHFWHMQIALHESMPTSALPPGIEVRPVAPDTDLPVVHRLLTATFTDHWGYCPEPYERWEREQTRRPSYDPSLWLLAVADRTPVGVLTANVYGDAGWVDELGVLGDYRGRGIGRALLGEVFATFAGRGIGVVNLNVDSENPTGAADLYERAGMRAVMSWDMWEIAMGHPSASGSPVG